MKREVKFRAWDSFNSKMIEIGELEIISINPNLDFANYDVMQFTGLKDKNGKEIYEGDLLVDEYPSDHDENETLYSYLPVVWCDKQLMWCVDGSFKKDGSFLTSMVDYFGEYLEVKGNIYENPELLNKE